MRIKAFSGVIVIAIASVIAIGASGAQRAAAAETVASCTLANHCYAIADWFDTPSTHGSGGTLNAHCLYNDNAPQYFTNEEMWQATNNADYAFNYWVEGGAEYGYNAANRHWFWADNRPNGGGYNQHFPSFGFSLDTNYGIGFVYEGNDQWQVTVASRFAGTSVANPPSGKALEAGTEMTTTSGTRSVGTISNLSYLDTGGVEHNAWPGSSFHGGGTATASMNNARTYISWSTPC
jgi:hypothetical protein